MRAIAREECDRAEARGETGYPAMWAADRLEVIEDCLRWLEVERAGSAHASLPLVKCEARFGRRHPGEADDELSRDEPIAIELGDRKLLVSGRIDRLSWDAQPPTRFRVIDYKTGKVRDEKPAQLQGGRMLQLPLYVLAGAELLGIDASAGEAAYVYPTRRGGFRTIGWEAAQLAERHDDVIEAAGRDRRRDRARRLHGRAVEGVERLHLLRLQADLPARPARRTWSAEDADPRLATFAERIRGVQ